MIFTALSLICPIIKTKTLITENIAMELRHPMHFMAELLSVFMREKNCTKIKNINPTTIELNRLFGKRVTRSPNRIFSIVIPIPLPGRILSQRTRRRPWGFTILAAPTTCSTPFFKFSTTFLISMFIFSSARLS